MARSHPLASPLLSAGRRDAAVWTSRLRSGNFVWRHVLNMCPSASCRLAFAQVVAAGSKRNFAPQWVCLAQTDSLVWGGMGLAWAAWGRMGIRGGLLLFKRAPYKQQAVENQSIICQMKTEPSSWTTAAANFFFHLASVRLAPIVAFVSASFANPAFSYLVSRCGTC